MAGCLCGRVNSEINATVELNWREKRNNEGEVTFQGGPVTLSAQGYITNNPVTNGASNMQTVDWKVTVGDMSTTGNFSVSPLYANGGGKEIGDSFNAYVSIYMMVDGNRVSGSIAWDAESGTYKLRARVDGAYTTEGLPVGFSYTIADAEGEPVQTIFDANGKLAVAGEYTITFTMTFGDVTYTCSTSLNITAPAAEA